MYNLIYIIILVLNIAISTYVLFVSKRISSKIFFLLSCSVSLWVFTNFLIDNSQSNSEVLLYVKLSILGPIFIGPLFLNFSRVFPGDDNKFSKNFLIGSLIPSVFLLPLVFTEYNVQHVSINEEFGVDFTPGALYYIFFPYIAFFILISLRNLVLKYNKAAGVAKVQLRLLALGFFISFLIAVLASLVLPILGFSQVGIFGPLATLIFVGTTAYTLLRHGLFDVRIIVGKITYYSFLTTLTYLSFYFFVIIDTELLGGVFSRLALALGVVFAIGFAIIYNYLNNYIKEKVESTIINPGYNPNEVIANLNAKINSELDYNVIADEFLSTLSRTIRPDYKSILLNDKDIGLKFLEGKQKNEFSENELIQVFNLLKTIEEKTIIVDLLEYQYPTELLPVRHIIDEVLSIVKPKGIEVIASFKQQSGDILGIILLGKKDGDLPYNSSEIRFLRNLTDVLSVTLARSFLFEEVKQFNRTLQQKVDDATQALAERNSQLAEQLRKERDMMDILGHELRTPLGTARSAIIMVEDMRKKGDVDQEKYDKWMKIALHNMTREKNLLETILQSARMENNRLQVNLEKVSVDEIINDAMDAFKKQAEEKGLELTAEIKTPGLYLHVDRTGIQQILDNLVSNAVKYTFKGWVKVVVEEIEGGMIHFKIVDTGEGISKEDLQNIGKKFFRANTHLTSDGKIGGVPIVRPGGTGIGVYVIKGLLEQFGSKLEIESEVGKGSTFGFKLKKLDLEELNKKKPIEGTGESDAFKNVTDRIGGDNVEAPTEQTQSQPSQPTKAPTQNVTPQENVASQEVAAQQTPQTQSEQVNQPTVQLQSQESSEEQPKPVESVTPDIPEKPSDVQPVNEPPKEQPPQETNGNEVVKLNTSL